MFDLTPLIRAYSAWRRAQLARHTPEQMQRRQLLQLVSRAASTRFGCDHGFARIRSVEDFQAAVPVRRYEDFWESYWQPVFPYLAGATWPDFIPYFALTSGTASGSSKYIPVSKQMVRSNRQVGLDVFGHHLKNRPRSRVFGGKNFVLSGTVDLKQEGKGVYSGDLTAIAAKEIPVWARRYAFPGEELSREADWERKIERIGRASLQEDIRNIAGTASWLLLYLNRLAEMTGRPRRISAFYPNLDLLVHGGVNFAPYEHQFRSWLEGSEADLREVYPASEGFLAVADRGPGEGLRLNLDTGLFFEFIPVEDLGDPSPRRHWIGNAHTDTDYAVVLTTCAGLWGYLLGDTVRFVGLDPPRILVTGRTSYFLSTFGEHLSGDEIAKAIAAAADALDVNVSEFTVGSVFPDAERGRGGHLFVVELDKGCRLSESALRKFGTVLDNYLRDINDDYASHRAGDFGMDPPRMLLVQPGTFADWMRRRGRLGGQNKVPDVMNDESLFDDIRRFAASRAMETAG